MNRATDVVREGSQSPSLQPALVLALLVGIVMIATEVLGSLTGWVRLAQSDLVSDFIADLVQKKALALDMSFFDTPNYYDLLHRVRTDARQQPLSMLQNVGSFAQSMLTLIGMMAIFITYSPLLPPVLLLSTLPALWVLLRYSRRYNRWRLKNTPQDRRSFYYDYILTERATAAEIRLFSVGDFYRQTFQTIRTRLRGERLRLNRDKMLTDLAATGVALLVAGGTMVWMGWRALQGLATLGDLVAFYQIFQSGQGLMQSVMRKAGGIYESVLFLSDLFEFFALEPRIQAEEEKPSVLPPLS